MRAWIDLALALVVGFQLGRMWVGFALRFTLRNSPEVIDEIRTKYDPQLHKDELARKQASRHA